MDNLGSISQEEWDALIGTLNQNRLQKEEEAKYGGFLGNLTKPVRGLLNTLGSAGTAIFNPREFYSRGGGFNDNFLSSKELQSKNANPFLQTSKDVAGLASFLIPAGAGVSGMAKAGLASGALSGYGASKTGDEILGTAQGAGLGAVTGGLLGKLSSGKPQVVDDLLSGSPDTRVNNLVDELFANTQAKKGIVNDLVKSKAPSLTSFDDYLDDLATKGGKASTALENYGVVGKMPRIDMKIKNATSGYMTQFSGKPEEKLLAFQKKMAQRGGDVAKLTKNSKAIINTKGLYDNLVDTLDNTRLNNIAFTQDVLPTLEKYQSGMPAEEAGKWFGTLNTKLANILGKDGEQAARKDILKAVRSALSKELKQNVPGVNDVLNELTLMHTIEKHINKTTQSGIGSTLKKAPVNLKPAIGKATDFLGKAMRGASKPKGLSGISKLKSATTKLTSQIPTMGQTEAQILQKLIPIINSQRGGANAQIPTELLSSPTAQVNTNMSPQAPQNAQQGEMSPQAQEILNKLISGDIKQKEADYAMRMLGLAPQGGGGGKTLPAGALLKISDARKGLELLGGLGQQITTAGPLSPITGLIRGNNPWDKEGKSSEAAITTVKQIVAKALEGGVLRKEDELKYQKMMPTMTDTQDTVDIKIKYLSDALNTGIQTMIEGYQLGGYNPYAGGEQPQGDVQTDYLQYYQ